ncbi:MAG TPA: 3D domain-containing protein [Candidatus Binatia bacterium]|nr:3D domain-containing protein [Candidatus Binatia bacterium]
MDTDWGHAIVIDPRELDALRADGARLRRAARRRSLGAVVALAGCVTAAAVAAGTAFRVAALDRRLAGARAEASRARTEAERATIALTALARSHADILAATEQAPSVGTKSWGRRFTVTRYLPRSPKYGRFNHGITATLTKADPAARIVAVDPKLIPYGSWVWIEDLGWFRAEDCGSAIKGFRLDVLTPTEQEAMAFGKQDRFAIVVPPANA